MHPKFIIRRDRKTDRFNPEKIESAISKAVKAVHLENGQEAIDVTFSRVIKIIDDRFGENIPRISDVDSAILESLREGGYGPVARAYEYYGDRRARVRTILGISSKGDGISTTDAALLIQSDSKDSLLAWNREKIINQLESEANLSSELAGIVSKKVENLVFELYERFGVRRLTTTDIRNFVDLTLRQDGLESPRRKQALLGIPTSDLEAILDSRSLENSNVTINNPEAVNLGIAERILKEYALSVIFDPEVTEAHLKGRIHIHDLGYPTRVYCSSHSLEYIKKFGLNKVLANLESKSASTNSAEVLNGHIQTFLASLQAQYAGALGFGFLNILYAPLLNRPVEVVKGRLGGKEVGIEKHDLESLVKQGVISFDPKGKGAYFKRISERVELMELSDRKFDQIAQELIFSSSQNAFSRGGQTLFIDFNIHTGVPDYLEKVPAVGPGGKYMIEREDGSVESVNSVPRFMNSENKEDPRNGDADNSKLKGEFKGGRIITYGYLEPTAQKFAKSLLEVWREGDKDGRPFHFPKCDLHVDKNSFEDPKQSKILDFASHVASENGAVYFMFDRGDDAVLAQCCRLKEKIEDLSMLKYPEKLRFCGFQIVTINLAQAVYRGGGLERTLEEIDKSMELALKAHLQKKEIIQRFLDNDGTPMRSLGKPSDDGDPYIDLEKSTYIIGLIGLNEAVEALTDKQLHDKEDSYRTGLEIISHMYKKIQEFKDRTGLKFSLEETPAESATRRLAKVDLQQFEEAKKVVKGTDGSPYYTNSIHFSPDANVGLVDRIEGQSKFHEMISSGAIIHAYVGEQRPNRDAIKKTVKNTLENTRCSQLVFSPTYTECDSCGNIMKGDKELCSNSECGNHVRDTLDPDTISSVTRVVGYYSRVRNWNDSQKQIFLDRKKAEGQYAGKSGIEMSWLYNPNEHDKLTIIEFGKEGCVTCDNLKQNVEREIEKRGLQEEVDFRVYHLNNPSRQCLVNAAMYDIPLDAVPSLVIAGKDSYWRKTAKISSVKGERSVLIMPKEIRENLASMIKEYN